MTSLDIYKIKQLILQMVKVESSDPPRWDLSNSLAGEALTIITKKELGGVLDPYVIKYLDDINIRKQDSRFGNHQRKKVVEAVQSLDG